MLKDETMNVLLLKYDVKAIKSITDELREIFHHSLWFDAFEPLSKDGLNYTSRTTKGSHITILCCWTMAFFEGLANAYLRQFCRGQFDRISRLWGV